VRIAATCLILVACAKAQKADPIDAAPPGVDSGPTVSACPADQFAIDVDPMATVTCTAIDDSTAIAIRDRCSVYAGWRDGCDGCASEPVKWGHAGGTCENGAGVDNTCTTPQLGDTTVTLFGLNFDGDVDGNDKIYTSLHCTTAAPAAGLAPCATGELVVGKLGSSWTCASLDDAVATYVHDHCSVYSGWQDNCGGCASPPVKFGNAGDAGCANGAGGDDTCVTAILGSETVQLFGLNPDGDVDDNDKLHFGLDCTDVAPQQTTATMTCPTGQFVTGTFPDGSFQCTSVAPIVASYFASHCSLYVGWHDSCDGCLDPPTKWGSVKVGACTNGVGVDSTCSTFTLAGRTVAMFGLNPDGNVDGNDALYVGLSCL
jgi:hypothetical protein